MRNFLIALCLLFFYGGGAVIAWMGFRSPIEAISGALGASAMHLAVLTYRLIK